MTDQEIQGDGLTEDVGLPESNVDLSALGGWKKVGRFGWADIVANGTKRALLENGRFTFEYTVEDEYAVEES